MDKKIALTFVFRLIGIILVLMYFFGHPLLYRIFPGFPVSSLNYFFYAGLLIYLVGAVLYYIFRKKIVKKNEQEEEDDQ